MCIFSASIRTVSVTFKEKQYPVKICLLAFNDDLALVALPGELFSQLGVSIKEKSPFRHTLVMGYTGGTTIGYVLTLQAALEGGYGAEDVPVAKATGQYLVAQSLLLIKESKDKDR